MRKQVQPANFSGFLNLLLFFSLLVSLITPVSSVLAMCEPEVTNDMDEGDCQALWQIYNATNGPNWLYSGNHPWPDGVMCGGTANGIWCDYTRDDSGKLKRRVYYLNLQNCNLVGELPGAAIGTLTSLKEINLGSNSLSGPIPSELAQLPQIHTIWLNKNSLTGTIPEGLLGDQANPGPGNIVLIELSQNQLSGFLPQSLGSDLAYRMSVSYNQNLTGPIPYSYTQYPELNELSYYSTTVCEPQDTTMQNWLDSLSYNQSSKIACDNNPGAPQSLSASDGTSDINVIIQWTRYPDAKTDYYILERSDGSQPWSQLASIKASLDNTVKYYDKSAVPPAAYYYRVKGCNGDNQCSGYSNQDMGYKNMGIPAPLTSSLSKYSDGLRTVRFDWPNVTGTVYYQLYTALDKGYKPGFIPEKFKLRSNTGKNYYLYSEWDYNDKLFNVLTENSIAVRACGNHKDSMVCGPAAMLNNNMPPAVQSLINLLLK